MLHAVVVKMKEPNFDQEASPVDVKCAPLTLEFFNKEKQIFRWELFCVQKFVGNNTVVNLICFRASRRKERTAIAS